MNHRLLGSWKQPMWGSCVLAPHLITHSELEEVILCRFFLSITSPSDLMILKLPDAGRNGKKGPETSVLNKCSSSPSCVSGRVPRVGGAQLGLLLEER